MNPNINIYSFRYGVHFFAVMGHSIEDALGQVTSLLKSTKGLEHLNGKDYDDMSVGEYAYHFCGD